MLLKMQEELGLFLVEQKKRINDIESELKENIAHFAT
jgi:hypothetical protein